MIHYEQLSNFCFHCGLIDHNTWNCAMLGGESIKNRIGVFPIENG